MCGFAPNGAVVLPWSSECGIVIEEGASGEQCERSFRVIHDRTQHRMMNQARSPDGKVLHDITMVAGHTTSRRLRW